MQQQVIEGFRLSPQQRRLWLLQRSGSTFPYRAQCAVMIEGNLDQGILDSALRMLVDRQEILRTTFHKLPGLSVAVQVIAEAGEVRFGQLDLSKLSPQQQQTAIDELLRGAGQMPFEVERGPLLDLTLCALSTDLHVMIVSLPSLCADGGALGNLISELCCCYSACSGGGDAAAEVMQYADLAQWQSDLLESAESEAGKAYWLKQDAMKMSHYQLPYERKAERPGGFRPGVSSAVAGPELIRQAEQLARSQEVPLASLLLANWQVLLYRLTGQSGMVIGAAYDGRSYQELEQAIGLFAKFLPITSSLKKDSTFSQVLGQVKQTTSEAYKWQECFSWELYEKSGSDRVDFFPACFEYDELPATSSSPGISFSIYKRLVCIDQFGLKLSCVREGEALTARLHYNLGHFSSEDARRLARQFVKLLDCAVSNPEAPIIELDLLDEAERRHLLVEFNDAGPAYMGARCVQHVFEAQAQQAADKVAVAYEGQKLTYQQLNERANQLAHHLQTFGVGPEVVVALFVERSLEMIEGLLAILKAGGAYVPLDPALPAERLAWILEDTRAPVVLTQRKLLEQLPPTDAKIICLDTGRDAFAQQSRDNCFSSVTSRNLAYVIYTSGSTGRPKGVAVEHRQLLNYSTSISDKLNLPPGASYASLSTLAADLGNTVIFPSLCTGRSLHIISQERASDPQELAAYFSQNRIDCMKITPSHLRALMAGPHPEQVLPRSCLVMGGEACRWELVNKIKAAAPGCSVINHYGPTETTVGVLTNRVVDDTLDYGTATVPIGRPIAGVQVYLLDSRMQPVPILIAGELYIGGASVARGYLNHPEMTAERFVPDPFSQRLGARLYRTGDVTRHLQHGKIEFLDRVDRQVKIRGYRAEPGEVETLLNQHPEISGAAVVAWAAADGDNRLAAYVVPRNGREGLVGELRAFLRKTLPEYLVPSKIIPLHRLPLTPNGKLDRRALPPPDQTPSHEEQMSSAPRTSVEEMLANLWESLLGVQPIRINDNFFELGGHSLLATQLVSRVREAFRVELPLRCIFDAPTIERLSERIETAMRAGRGLEAPPITRAPRSESLPLSFAQQRLWFLDQLEPGSSIYNIPVSLRFKGDFRLAVFELSMSEIIRRHEALRTTFATVEGRPIQVIVPARPINIPVVDLRELPAEAREAEAERLMKQEAQQPFDLQSGPLLRIKLLQLAEDENVVLFTLHHIVSDHWSTGVLIKELSSLYEAFLNGGPSPLPELTIQYADFARWQREWIESALDMQLAYWKQALQGSPPVLQLPTDRPRPKVQTHRGARAAWRLPKELSESLKALSKSEGVTLFMTLLAALYALLYRYTQQQDIIIGSPIAGRNRKEVENLIGFFVNMMVLRTELAGDPGFRDLLSRVRDVALEAYAHQDLPFEKLVDELQPDRSLSHSPLFQVVLALQNAPRTRLRLEGLELVASGDAGDTAKFDLTLVLSDTEEGLAGTLEYNTDLFDPATISRMLSHFQTMLEAIADDPAQSISLMSIMTEAERHQLLTEWTGRKRAHRKDDCLHHLFEEQVRRMPNQVAVAFESERLTYDELNRRANQLAHRLRALGVGPEVMVALCLERSLEMIVAILGVLKAGGGYVPLDPVHPKERRDFMIENANAPVLLTQESLLDRPPDTRATILCLDSQWQQIAQESDENPDVAVCADNLAYVIYTSGSTGKPKGVSINHKNVTRLFTATDEWYHFGPDDVWTLFHSYAFDFSVWEIWGALIYGGKLVVVPYWVSRSPQAFYDLLVQHAVTVLNQTPSAFRQLIAAEESAKAAGAQLLRLVIFGGEALDLLSLKPWFERHSDKHPQLVNMYGITETTVHVTYRPITKQDVIDTPSMSLIGVAIEDLEVFVLDRHLQPVPVGVAGELCVGGEGLARGYLNLPEQTAERFVPNPYGDSPGARLYRSGDLARYLANQDMEYRGRIDQQVKVRGFRIEPGEIEAAFREHPGVHDVVVVAREDAPGERRLVAYVVLKDQQTPTVGELRALLQQKLPDYLVPSAVVVMDELPLTANGKVDKRALPPPDTSRLQLEESFARPRNAVEEVLAGCWGEALGLAEVGINDNFFELGGDSILAIQIVAKVNQAGLHFTPKDLFQHQTIAELALAVETAGGVRAAQGLVTGPVPLTPIQHWFFDQGLLEPNHWNQAVLLEATNRLDASVLRTVLVRLLEHHDALRLRFEKRYGLWQQMNAPTDGQVPFTRIDLSAVMQPDRAAVIEREADRLQASLNLSQGPLIRMALFESGEHQPQRLLMIIHHLAVDGVSWRILLEDVEKTYRQIAGGGPSKPALKTTSFKDWAESLTAYARSTDCEQESRYWLEQASLPNKRLPVDYSAGENTEASARTLTDKLSARETKELLQEVSSAYHAQVIEALLTALLQTFSEWMQTATLAVDLEGHGREEIAGGINVTRTVGWFTTIYPVVLSMSQIGDEVEALQSVKEQMRRIPNNGIGFGLLKYLSGDESIRERMHRLEPPEISFNYLGQFDHNLPQGALFGLADGPVGTLRSLKGRRHHLLNISALISGDQFRMAWTYSENLHKESTIRNLIDSYMASLRSLIARCKSPEAGAYTPSDFPLLQVGQDELDKLLGEVEFEG